MATNADTVARFLVSNAPESWSGSGSTRLGLREVLQHAIAWPPDLFGLLWLLLNRTGAYRYVATPPSQLDWPPRTDWDGFVRDTAKSWWEWQAGIGETAMPSRLAALLAELEASAPEVEIGHLQHNQRLQTQESDGDAWKVVRSTLELFAIADELCTGLGYYGPIPLPGANEAPLASGVAESKYTVRALANLLLSSNGTLSRLSKASVTVLPKLKTPQRGLNLRCMSHHVSCYIGETNLLWRAVPFATLRSQSLSMLLVPHPGEMKASWFRPSRSTGHGRRRRTDWYFSYACGAKLDLDSLVQTIVSIRNKHGAVDIVAMPELSMDAKDLEALQRSLERHGESMGYVPAIICGVNGEEGTFDGANYLAFCFYFAGKWYKSVQRKQHRWRLTQAQLAQYGLAGALSGALDWWEELEIQQRRQVVLLAAPWLAIAPLICEDLAQEDPSADLLRAIGPTLVYAALLDGPQLPERWPGRHANVLADDPGSAVLTLTAFGMARASRRQFESDPPEGPVTVALWRDSTSGWRQLKQSEKDTVHFVTAAGRFVEEYTADGRSDGGAAASISLRQHVRVDTKKPLLHPEQDLADAISTTGTHPIAQGAVAAQDLKELTGLVFLCDYLLACGVSGAADYLAELVRGGGEMFGSPSSFGDWFGSSDTSRMVLADISRVVSARSSGRRTRKATTENPSDPRELDFAVLRLLDLIREAFPSSRHQELTKTPVAEIKDFWESLANIAQQRLELSERAAANDPRDEKIGKHIKFAFDRYQVEPRTVARTERLVAVTMLCCLRTRLELLLDRGALEARDDKCLARIDEMLARANLRTS